MAAKILLFDLDGTLIDMWKIHEKAYEATINELYKVPNVNFRSNYTPGDSNEDVVRSNLRALGYKNDFIEARIGQVVPTLRKYYSKFITPSDVQLLAGVRELLELLMGRKNTVLAIVTGNREATAKLIMEGAGISDYFAFVIGADEAQDRPKRLAMATEKAKKILNVSAKCDVYYFDDSYASIPVSRKLGIKSVAVATGETSYEELAK
ncbi:MAG: HAD family hydrolase, partial [Candidatus Micrarchaeota archaeon]|nr:HAD family hydrolase [Candidatus Micrarchaeota archaeon]